MVIAIILRLKGRRPKRKDVFKQALAVGLVLFFFTKLKCLKGVYFDLKVMVIIGFWSLSSS